MGFGWILLPPYGHFVWSLQPEGKLIRLGASPLRMVLFSIALTYISGIEESLSIWMTRLLKVVGDEEIRETPFRL
ncbi:MAG: hypothetical protein DRN54_00345 [Thaumarchaeota archaeon]|nr:MAG: hypothetical protein DRN54_00345 [Nitrososphaerota archaeon]